MAVDPDPVLSRGPPCCKPLLRPAVTNPLSRISRGYAETYYRKVALRFWRSVAEGFLAEHPRPLQTSVAKWPLKPVTNPCS